MFDFFPSYFAEVQKSDGLREFLNVGSVIVMRSLRVCFQSQIGVVLVFKGIFPGSLILKVHFSQVLHPQVKQLASFFVGPIFSKILHFSPLLLEYWFLNGPFFALRLALLFVNGLGDWL